MPRVMSLSAVAFVEIELTEPDADRVVAGAALRIAYIVLPGAMLTPSIGSSALGDHLAQRLRLPARAVVASSAALERLRGGDHQVVLVDVDVEELELVVDVDVDVDAEESS